jgi:ribose transport system ATP-binding protein
VVTRYIKEVRIKTPSGAQAARNLSGGNQQKVVIAKWLHAKCQVLIFDEPTRGIDVGAKSEIYDLMRRLTAQGDAIIMVSSELPEVVGLSDRVIVMRQQRVEKTLERPEEITPENIMYYATGSHHA